MGVRDGRSKDPTSHSARKRSMRRAKWRRASSAAASADGGAPESVAASSVEEEVDDAPQRVGQATEVVVAKEDGDLVHWQGGVRVGGGWERAW